MTVVYAAKSLITEFQQLLITNIKIQTITYLKTLKSLLNNYISDNNNTSTHFYPAKRLNFKGGNETEQQQNKHI